ncbi:hypothetical protein Ga0100231_020345 [Opitutaceae bacterium TAV4]|nr:hypothetical protein Ga0100231_020345 [Opitutaceae bacterium TAV4]RRK00403.1 hypothetical protein Ga0100230_021150 [Opitutaceae bacterium TAV3]
MTHHKAHPSTIKRLALPVAFAVAFVAAAHADIVSIHTDSFEVWPQNPEYPYWPIVSETGWDGAGPGGTNGWEGTALYGISNVEARTGTQSLFFKNLADTTNGNSFVIKKSFDISAHDLSGGDATLSWSVYSKMDSAYLYGGSGADVYIRTRYYDAAEGGNLIEANESTAAYYTDWAEVTYGKSLTGNLVNAKRVEIEFNAINWTAVSGGAIYLDDLSVSLTTGAIPETATYGKIAGLFILAWAIFGRRMWKF